MPVKLHEHTGDSACALMNEEIAPTLAALRATHRRKARRAWFAFGCLLWVALGCSTADLFQRPAPTLIVTRTLAPTFTPTPEGVLPPIVVTPPLNGTPGVIIVPPGTDPREVIPIPPTLSPTPVRTEVAIALTASAQPTDTPPPTATETPTPSHTPTETPSHTPTITPTPFIIVDSGFVALRTGPGVEFPLVAQLGPGIPIAVVAQNPEGTWYQICCVNGASVWVAASHVLVNNNPQAVALALGGTPPSPTPTFTPTATGTETPTPTATPYPFQRTLGPQFFPTNNEFLTIWVKLHIGPLRLFTNCDPDNTTADKESPAEGYFLKVLFNNFDRPSTNGTRPSADKFECSASPGLGNRFEYNIKYEYVPPDPRTLDVPTTTPTPSSAQLIGDGTWTVYVVDGAGNQLSAPETFTTQAGNNNREIYIAWERVR